MKLAFDIKIKSNIIQNESEEEEEEAKKNQQQTNRKKPKFILPPAIHRGFSSLDISID